MFKRILKSNKQLLLGRWRVDENLIDINRKIDLANCDSCGTCSVPEYKQNNLIKTYDKNEFLYDDNINDFGIYPGSFTLHKKF
jgi:hypothetical protein